MAVITQVLSRLIAFVWNLLCALSQIRRVECSVMHCVDIDEVGFVWKVNSVQTRVLEIIAIQLAR
jgi:hypothetical protein